MIRTPTNWFRRTLIAFVLAFQLSSPALAVTVQLKDGRVLSGKVVKVPGVAEDPNNPDPSSGEVVVSNILLVDDGLRRTFISRTSVREILEQETENLVRIRLDWQNVAKHGGAVGRVGQMTSVTPFDRYGRRIYEMQAAAGPLAVVQGITEITPVYTRVQGLVGQQRPIVWDARIATSSIPNDQLAAILAQAIPQKDLDARLQVVRIYLQSERYTHARQELERVLADFPEMKDWEDDLRQLQQLGARRVLSEIRLRREAGQHELVRSLLTSFPTEEVAGETLQEVRELLTEYDQENARRERAISEFDKAVAAIKEPAQRKAAEEISSEVHKELNVNTLPRMASFLRLADDATLTGDQKSSLAISGWLLGANDATDKLAVALSLVTIRGKVLEYLQESVAARRAQLLAEMQDMEGASVERIAQLLSLMKPPEPLPPKSERSPGCHELAVAIPESGDVRYLVQLPPEYDPLRSYPTIIALHGAGYPPELMLDYWAGMVDETGTRRGQAMRHGYITIVIDWQTPHQHQYEYSLREHQAVLSTLRDAQRKFAIDTDRIYLTGHDIGGNAAWDIGLAHPDLWAGVVGISGFADRYCARYWENSQYVPWYFVNGELDGDKFARNAREFDRYLRPNWDATVVEYLGRGFEPFSDEIQRLFDWMNRKRRGPPPKEFKCSTMRPWDNFFWWLEVADMPAKAMVAPEAWPPKRGVRPVPLKGRVYENNKLGISAQTGKTTVWLSPEVIDFKQPITVELNGRKMNRAGTPIEPSLEVLLEDARARGDRKHPFWAKVESP
ncbi:MAG: peptidase [Pirellulales bacterium]